MTRLNTKCDWFTLQCLKSEELCFLNIFFGNKVANIMFCRPVMLRLYNCNDETIEVIAGHKHFLREPHVGQP